MSCTGQSIFALYRNDQRQPTLPFQASWVVDPWKNLVKYLSQYSKSNIRQALNKYMYLLSTVTEFEVSYRWSFLFPAYCDPSAKHTGSENSFQSMQSLWL